MTVFADIKMQDHQLLFCCSELGHFSISFPGFRFCTPNVLPAISPFVSNTACWWVGFLHLKEKIRDRVDWLVLVIAQCPSHVREGSA